ncbi:MAG TPA: hypothetical protein VID72_11250, partial [Ktedonobacterales bacterium]
MASRRGRGKVTPETRSAQRGARRGAGQDERPKPAQPAAPQARLLTRRAFVATAAATVAVAGCAPFASHSAVARKLGVFTLTLPAAVYHDATIPTALASAVAGTLGGHGGVSVAYAIASTVPAPDFLLTFGAAPKGFAASAVIGASAWSLATHARVPVDEITHAQAQGLLSGAIGDWSAVGAPAGLPARVFWLADLPTPPGVALASGATRLPTVDALLDALRITPGAVAALPAEALDWTLHHVGVDGVFPAQGRGDAAT